MAPKWYMFSCLGLLAAFLGGILYLYRSFLKNSAVKASPISVPKAA